MAAKVSRKAAEQALAAVKERFAPYIEGGGNGPEIREDWDWTGAGPRTAIVWEEGPFEWAYLAVSGGVDEELAGLLAEEGQAPPPSQGPITWPAGLYVEPATSWALSLYREG